jgi:hypothetical protein
MLIVASLLQPRVKWGLVDRMIIAAQSGKLQADRLPEQDRSGSRTSRRAMREADDVLTHYQSTVHPHAPHSTRPGRPGRARTKLLKDRATVLAGTAASERAA